MKKNRKKHHAGRVVSLVLTLCMTMAFLSTTALAGVTDVTGGTTSNVYKLTYHTKVKMTANITVQDSEGNTVNTYPVSEESDDFIVGNVSDDAVQAEITRLEGVVNSQLPSGAVKSNRTTNTIFDHFESSCILESSKDQTLIGDNAQDESGTTSTLDVHEYQIYEITEDWIVESNTDDAEAITLVDFGNVWKNLDSTKPVVFTTELNPNTDCPKQMEITEQAWVENESRASISSNAYPEAGKEYVYEITLTAKEGYYFPTFYGTDFDGKVIVDGVEKYSYGHGAAVPDVYDNGKTLKVKVYPAVIATNGTSQDDYVIDNVIINNAPASCTVGEAPKAMATKGDNGAYTFYEYWEEWAQTENGLEPVKFWYSDAEQMNRVPADQRITAFEEGKIYSYSVITLANENYTFASKDDGLSVMLNGKDFIAKSEMIWDGKSLMIGPGAFMKPLKPATQKEIELIEINNATLTFKDGDKPVFTGTIPDDAKYRLVFEEWRTDGEWTRSDEWFNDAEHHGDDKDITAFNKDKTYNYFLYLTTNAEGSEEGWYFGPNTKLKINGKEVSFTRRTSDNEQQFSVTTGITMTPTAAGASDYKIIEGANGAWTQNSDGTLVFRANGDFSKFTGVKVDGKLIDAKNYTAVSGSTVITLKADYLKTLSVGTHKLTVVYTDGECSTNFEVKQAASEQTKPTEGDKTGTTTPTSGKDTTSPKTGDNSNLALWFIVLFVSFSGVMGCIRFTADAES